IDLYKNKLGSAPHVYRFAVQTFEKLKPSRFFAFVHFEEPDEQGHLYGDGSPQYMSGIKRNDLYLGLLLKEMAKLKLDSDLTVFVAADHGFNRGEHNHSYAPDTFLASSVQRLKKEGDRRDLAPTFLQ